jgi:hypothetical protein
VGLNTNETIYFPFPWDREGQTISLIAYEIKKKKLPNFMILNAQANEIQITPTSIDNIGPYVIKIDLNDTFNARTSY